MSHQFAHFPGTVTRQHFTGYDNYQAQLWDIVDDMYHSMANDYTHTRLPTPGLSFYEKSFRMWQDKAINSWKIEATRDAKTRGIELSDFTHEQWLCFYERVKAARNTPGNAPAYLDN
jgi:hypothetical protein